MNEKTASVCKGERKLCMLMLFCLTNKEMICKVNQVVRE